LLTHVDGVDHAVYGPIKIAELMDLQCNKLMILILCKDAFGL